MDVKILWDFKIQTDKHLAHNIPDITVVEKKRVKIEIERLWEKQATIVPVVIGSLGTIPRDLRKHLRTIDLESISSSQLQKTVLLGTTHILRKYL